jgi:hypothetical protein
VDPAWFEKVLYPFQDAALAVAARVETKAVGVFAADVARALLGATEDDWRLVRWIPPPPPAGDFLRDLRAPGEDLLLIR